MNFIISDEYRNFKHIPITRQRAMSAINNPRGKEDDTVLFLGYEDGELVAYLGVLADEIFFQDIKYRVAWISSLWVHRKHRRKGLALDLLKEAAEVWNHRLLITNYAPELVKAFEKMDEFVDLQIRDGIRGYLRFNFTKYLCRENTLWKHISPFIKLVESVMNIFNEPRVQAWKGFSRLKNINYEYVNEIDDETAEFIKERYEYELTRRGQDELDWFLKYPWILETPFEDRDSKRYFFPAREPRFMYLNIKVYDEANKMIAYLMLCVKGHSLTVPYCYFDRKDAKVVSDIIYAHMFKMGLKDFTVYRRSLSNYLKHNETPFILKKRLRRHYIISKEFKESIEKRTATHLQDGDGDCGFAYWY